MKPLIFIHPLSESLKKLINVLKETAEEDNFEIFEIDDLNEAHQLIPTVGQCLCLMSNPKKCATFLQPIRRIILKSSSKVILLSPKKIPHKTLDKFSKIGLTECIVEPVPPKTLLYKVNLLLRSIADSSLENDDDEEMSTKSDKEISAEEAKELKQKKLNNTDSEEILDYTRKKVKKSSSLEFEERPDKKKSRYEEEEIQTEWSGKVDKKNGLEVEEEDDKKKKGHYKEEQIEKYYKNKQEQNSEDDQESTNNKKKSNSIDEEISNDIYKTNDPILEDDEIEAKKKKKQKELELSEEDQESKLESVDEIDGYMRGSLGKQEDLDQDSEQEDLYNKNIEEIEEEEEEKNKKDFLLEDEESIGESLKNKNQSFEEIEEENKDLINEEEDYEELKKKKKLEVIDGTQDLDEIRQENEELESNIDDLNDDKGKVEHIDQYYRGGAAKKEELEEEEEENQTKDLQLEEEVENAEDYKKKKKAQELLEEDDNSIEKEDPGYEEAQLKNKNKNEEFIDSEAENYHKKNNEDLEDADAKSKNKNEELEDDSDSDYHNRKKNQNLSEIIDDRDKTLKNEEDEKGEFNRKKGPSHLEIEDDDRKKGVQQKADRISTHYSSKTSTKHNENDWNIGDRDKKNNTLDDEVKKHKDLELNYGEKGNLGEQTIDYSQIKKEFNETSMRPESQGEKKSGKKFIANNLGDAQYSRKKYKSDEDEESNDFGPEGESEEEEEDIIYSSDARGLDVAVKALNIYQKEKYENDDIYSLITSEVEQRYEGKTYFMFYNKDAETFNLNFSSELYNSPKNEKSKIIENFKETIERHDKEWKNATIPGWSDDTFQEEKIHFNFPFYEGVTRIGIGVVFFENGFEEDKSSELEVILESSRSLYLNQYYKENSEALYKKQNTNIENKQKTKEKKGFFSRFIKDKAS